MPKVLLDESLRQIIGLVVAALIQVAVPDEFFLSFGSQPLLQMLVILVIAVPMYICSTGSIPVAASLMMKGLSPGAALVMLMADPAVEAVPGVERAKASASANTLTVKGPATEEAIRTAVVGIGYTFKGPA